MWCAAVVVFGCSGDVEGPGGPTPNVDTPVAGGALPSQPVGGALPAARAADLFQDGQASTGCDPSLAGLLGDTPLRRLTQTQYQSSIVDLFAAQGITVPPETADDIPGDDLAGAFPSNGHVSVSEQHVRAYEAQAQTTAAFVTAPGNLEALVTECNPAVGDDTCARGFVQRFATSAFRKPASPALVDALMTVFSVGAARGFANGVSLVVEAVLQSPEFLYHVESKAPTGSATAPLDPHELAARMSYFLWNSLPDAELSRAAAAGELADPAMVRLQAERLLADARGERSIRVFTHYWLSLGQAAVTLLDPAVYPEWNAEFNQAAIDETHAFMQHVLRGAGGGTLTELFTASYGFPTAPLTGVYGGAAGNGVAPVELPPGERAGILTQPGFLLAHSDPAFKTTAIKRGATVVNNFLCYEITFPDNVEIDLNVPNAGPGVSARQVLEGHTAAPVCQGCHAAMNPVGFAFDRYDAIGKIRDVDPHGNPLSDEAVLRVGDPVIDGPVKGPIELGRRLAESDNARSCMVRQMFRYALSRDESDADTCTLVGIAQRFEASGFDVRRLMFDIVTSDGFRMRPST